MKALLFSILSLALIAPSALAQGSKTKEPVAGATLYRSIPRVTATDTGKTRYRVTRYKPTQYFYMRDTVISYRYTTDVSYGGSADANTYLGPQGAIFVPQDGDLPGSASVRSYAAVTRRGQPGVGMAPIVAPAVRKKTVSRTSGNAALALK